MFSKKHITRHAVFGWRPGVARILVLTLLTLALVLGAATRALQASKYPYLEPNTMIVVRTTAYNHREADHLKYADKNALGGKLRHSGGVTEHVNFTGSIRVLEPNVGSAAADWSRFPVGTRFEIVRTKQVFEVEDYGIALGGTQTIDLYKPSLAEMKKWGVKFETIRIIKLGSFERSLAHLQKAHPYDFIVAMRKDVEERLKEQKNQPRMIAKTASVTDPGVSDYSKSYTGSRPARMPAPPSQSAYTRNKPPAVDPGAWKRNMPK